MTSNYPLEELDDFLEKTKILVGDDCVVNFEFVDDIKTTPSGKYRYAMSEISGFVKKYSGTGLVIRDEPGNTG